MCCKQNLHCKSICCDQDLAVCVVKSPCPFYDGSIEKWEEEEYNKAIDEQEQALDETRQNQDENTDQISTDKEGQKNEDGISE